MQNTLSHSEIFVDVSLPKICKREFEFYRLMQSIFEASDRNQFTVFANYLSTFRPAQMIGSAAHRDFCVASIDCPANHPERLAVKPVLRLVVLPN